MTTFERALIEMLLCALSYTLGHVAGYTKGYKEARKYVDRGE